MRILRGEIYFVKAIKNSGSEQGGNRPAIVVSNDYANQYSDVVEVVYLTTAEKVSLPTHVEVICRFKSTALCEQINSVSKSRLTEFVRRCNEEEMKKIDDALMISLALKREGEEN